MRLPKSKVSTAKQPTIDQVAEALNIVAFSTLKNKTEPLTDGAINYEVSRLERCIEECYVNENHEMQFLEFASNFLVKNYKELVFGSQFDGYYLNGVPDPLEEAIDPTEY